MSDVDGSILDGNPEVTNTETQTINQDGPIKVVNGNATPPAPNLTWMDGLPEEMKGFVQNKGWQSPQHIAESYRNLEKMIGQKGQPIPADDDAEGWNKFYNSLGRPEKAADYKFDLPAEYNPELVNFFSQAAHKVGLSKKQADAFLEGYLDFENSFREEAVKRQEINISAAQGALKQEWGNKYQENINLAARAVTAIGLDKTAQIALEESMGQAAFAKVFQKIGEAICSEDSTPSNTQVGGFGPITPAAAQARKDELMSREDWVTSYMNGDAHKVREMDELNKAIIAGRPKG